MSDERENDDCTRPLLARIANEAGIQFLVIPAVAIVLALLANFIWAHR